MKSEYKILILAFLLATITLLQTSLSARDIIVDKNGNVNSIKKGLRLCQIGDRLIVKKDYYKERDGIYLEFSENSTIENNISEDNLRYGLHFMFSHRCVYKRNIFRRNVGGVAVMYTKFIHMYNNKFENNWGPASYGLLLKDINDSEIKFNLFHENSTGIYLENSMRVKLEKNNFIDNGWALKIRSNSMDNDFTDNNFIDNTFDVSTGSKHNFNTFRKNYWSKYSGYDLNHDGYGDVPYKPVGLFSAIVENNSPAMILLRSLFIQILEVAEKVVPAITPVKLEDVQPLMRRVK